MKQSLMSKNDLCKESEIATQNGRYNRILDTIYFTDCYDRKPDGTIHNITKLYDPDDDSIRLSFSYHIGGGFYSEYLYKQEDVCEVNKLLDMGKKIYEEKVSKIVFSRQPDWID